MNTLANSLGSRLFRYRLTSPASMRRGVASVAAIAFLIVASHTPIVVRTNLLQDDGLFMALGRYLAAGHWLGPYGQNTLAKGPGYPLFLALNSWLGLPVGLSQATLNCGAIALFFWVFARLAKMPNLAVFGFIFTLWAPAPYLPHVLRESIYPGQTLLVLAALSYTLFGEFRPKARLGWALLTGMLAGWMALTREEGIWIAPGIGIFVLYGAWVAWRKRMFVYHVLTPMLVMIAALVTCRIGFSCLNWVAYGRATGVEMNSAPFKNALAALQSVDAGPRTPYLPVSRQARFAIYAVSPSFRSLKDYFDPANGKTLWQFGCSMYPETCGDIAGGWFMWALRDAAATKGYYASPDRAADFFQNLTGEVTRACRDHRLKCSPSLFALLPHISEDEWRNLPASLLEGIRLITDEEPVDLNPGISAGSPKDLNVNLAFLGNPVITPVNSERDANEDKFHIAGWYISPSHSWISGQVDQANGPTRSFPISRVASPDLMAGLNDPGAAKDRFDFTVACGTPCHFNFVDDQGATLPLNLLQRAGQRFQSSFGAATLNIDALSKYPNHDARPEIQARASTAVHRFFLRTYSLLLPWLAGAALLAMFLVAGLAVFKRRLDKITVLAAAVWALIASRLLLLGIVDISSFHGMQPRLLAPAYVLMCIAVVLSFAALKAMTDGIRRPGNGSSPVWAAYKRLSASLALCEDRLRTGTDRIQQLCQQRLSGNSSG
ncbi:hypothetical protein ACFPPA_14760 [Rhodanobacter ginsengisoli]|uniref:Glycosyltransferase RgtA/B/C/D-like domain-containing protein n=1 Tax=Rhodanobacter ginsengisoli TaxID=418646 RepID=A0ABW0QQI1_9GAMM